MNSNTIDTAYRVTLDLLSRREHSKFELEHKLKRKGFTTINITKTLQKIVDRKLQSDFRFAENYISIRQSRGFGPLRIKNELVSRGIDQNIISNLLAVNDETWFDLAKTIYKKKFNKNKLQNLSTRDKQTRFLYYKGFTSDQIKNCL
jgi:regulatory protein